MYFGPDHTIVIAEAGINHDGDFEKALRMIDVAVEAKADFVKFQTFKADVLVLPEAERSTYIVEGSHEGESFRDLLRRLEQSYDQQRQLKEICDEKGIKFLSTAFDHDSLDFLCDELKCEIIKIPSGDLTNLPFLRHAASKKLPIVLSTGMGDLDEIDEAMETLQSTGAEAICLLHCVSWYPCPMEIANLRAMLTLRDRYGTPVGYSDHTLGVALPPAAVALGARVIEKHYTLDPDDFGPDHKASLSPEELVTMVSLIRDVECGLGSGRKGADSIDDIELNQRRVHRRSIVTTKPVKSGEVFTRENLGLKRPGTGMPPREFEFLLGKTAARDIASDSLLSPADVAG